MTTELVAIRMPKSILEALKPIAEARQWSRSKTIAILLESALTAQLPEDAEFRPSVSDGFVLPAASGDHAVQPASAKRPER